jgi:SAM-dependent methyltransferase
MTTWASPARIEALVGEVWHGSRSKAVCHAAGRRCVMTLRRSARVLRDGVRFTLFKLQTLRSSKEKFECPVCGYLGPFMDVHPPTGVRRHAKCPYCGAFERHRLQYLVIQQVLQTRRPSAMRMLHFAPEPCFRALFRRMFEQQYTTADLAMDDVDCQADMRHLPFRDASYDFVMASAVLDYIPDDINAIREIRRILTPTGIALLPISLVSPKTVEYAEPNVYESGHVRSCGMDYFERYEAHFRAVHRLSSESFPARYQLFVYEDRTPWPSKISPLRPAMPGERHLEVVPICYA